MLTTSSSATALASAHLYGPISFSSLLFLSSPLLSCLFSFSSFLIQRGRVGVFWVPFQATDASATRRRCYPRAKPPVRIPASSASDGFHHGRKLTIG